MCEQMHFAESHTAAHDEKQRSILGKTEMAAHILFGCRARKCGPHRNTERKQFFFRDAAGCKLRDQILVRNHIVIAVRLFPERNARVIGGNGNAGNRQPSFLFHPGQCFRRIKMCGDNGIKMVLINIICKRISKPRICIVNGGISREISVPAHQADRVRRSRPEKRRRASHKLRRPVRRYAFVRGSSDPEPRLRGDKNSDFLLMQRPQHCGHRQ
mgnify:CR=1 FL=1